MTLVSETTFDRAWQLTERMLSAAREANWDSVIDLDLQRSALLSATSESASSDSRRLSDADETHIRQMLAANAELETLVRAWMREANDTLGSLRTEQKLQKAYDFL